MMKHVYGNFMNDSGTLSQRECHCMARRRALRHLEQSGLGDMLARYTFESWQTPERWQAKVLEEAKRYAADPKGWFVTTGRSGTGKTHLCTAICGELLQRGLPVRYIRKILSDQVYTGDMVQGKTSAAAHKQSLVRPEDWIVVEGTHEPLVSRELFDQVQVARAQASQKGGAQTEKVPYTENILRGKIFCGCCGKSLHRQRSHGQYVYHCIANDRIGKGACPGKVRLREDDLFATILTILQKESAAIVENSFLVRQMGDRAAGQRVKTAQEVSELRQEIERSRKHLRGLYEGFVAGHLTRTEYQAQKTDYEQKIGAASARARQLLERQELMEKQVNGYLDLSDWLASVFENPVLTASLADRVIERIDVSSPTDIDIHFKFINEFDQIGGVEYG